MIKKLSLCAARHQMPAEVEGAIFPAEVNPLDTDSLYETAGAVLEGVDTLHLYVTGLTVALIEVVKLCADRRINLTLYHFNRDEGDYYPQPVLSYRECGFCRSPIAPGEWYCPSCGAT
jgi:hypothetical protein